jgi:hypothetical protein
VTDWIARAAPDVLGKNLGVRKEVFRNIPSIARLPAQVADRRGGCQGNPVEIGAAQRSTQYLFGSAGNCRFALFPSYIVPV